MLDIQLSVSAANHAGQMQMRQQILDFLAGLVDLADDQQETNILHEILMTISEEFDPPSPAAANDEDDPDFEHICAYMFAKGYDHIPGGFVDRLAREGAITHCSFADAATEWHTSYIEQCHAINRAEMWGE